MERLVLACAAFLAAALQVHAAAPQAAPSPAQHSPSQYQSLVDAANAVVLVHAKVLPNARSIRTLGDERMGSGVVIAPEQLVLTIGYLILEAEEVEITTSRGRKLPATVVAYDHATGFGLLRPIGPLDVKPIKLGKSAAVAELDRVMTVGAGGEENVAVATVVSRRPFTGYWEYMVDNAIFTSPPRADHSGAALVNKDGELVGIGSLFVMNAAAPDERLPGNMFVPTDLLKPILAEMIRTGRQAGGKRPWLGVSSLEEDGHIKVLRVSDDSPAAEAGIAPGDIILSLGGQKLETLPQFYKRLWSAGAPGVEVQLKVLHGSEVRDVRIRSIDRTDLLRKKPTI
jgi:S1-C subfamily serine protease